MSLSTWLDVSMATTFWQAYFFKISISLILKLNKSFIVVFFNSLAHFMAFLVVLITFDPILVACVQTSRISFLRRKEKRDVCTQTRFWTIFLRFWTNPEIQDGGPRWPPFRNDYAIITSCGVITSWYRRQGRYFVTYYLLSKSRCHSFYILGVTEGDPPRS